ncbi:MAG: rhomboid family intramembrane serine protease [Chitinophagales bacterium]|nr:rhomboid family intramembrane serine protease [Chitinophagales bacterium]
MFNTNNRSIDTRSVVFNLIAINVLLFVASQMIDSLNDLLSLHYVFNTHDFIKRLDPTESSSFQPFQLVTHMFMHGNLGHIFSNMFALFMFGSILERFWGGQRFLFFYLSTGFGAVLLHMLVQVYLVYDATGMVDPLFSALEQHPEIAGTYFSNTVGASGAVFGILVAFGMLFPNTELMLMFFPVPIKAKYFVSMYVLWEIYRGISMSHGDNVAHFAHLGGALFGYILVKIWNKNRTTLY